jgi:hypothetical protein
MPSSVFGGAFGGAKYEPVSSASAITGSSFKALGCFRFRRLNANATRPIKMTRATIPITIPAMAPPDIEDEADFPRAGGEVMEPEPEAVELVGEDEMVDDEGAF